MAYTIKEIAKIAGVSVGTVDRVIHNRGKVNSETEKRVRRILEVLNYQPNVMAKSLALRRYPATVGIVSHVQPTFSNYAVEQADLGIQAAIAEIEGSGISFRHVYGRNFDVDHQVSLIDELVKEGIAALMLQPISSEVLGAKIASLNIPVFCFMNDISMNYPHYFVGIDNYKAGGMAAGLFHLINPELQNMAFISSSLSMFGNIKRSQGFHDHIKQLYGSSIIRCEMEAVNDDFSTYKAVYEMLSKNRNIDSLFFSSGAAEACFNAIEEIGLLGKIVIVAFDLSKTIIKNIKNGYVAATINQNSFQHTYISVKRIYDYIVTGVLPKQHEVYVNSEIIIRENLV
jgi:LacI family transcriptional regulator